MFLLFIDFVVCLSFLQKIQNMLGEHFHESVVFMSSLYFPLSLPLMCLHITF